MRLLLLLLLLLFQPKRAKESQREPKRAERIIHHNVSKGY